MNKHAIEMLGITKVFGTLVANNSIDLTVDHNTIHGIIGENGAGKSTLMSVLFGLYTPDTGIIKLNGVETFIKTPHDATRLRIGMVHQHFKLVGIYNAVDNIMLGNEVGVLGVLNRRKARERISELSKRYGFNIDLKTPVNKLSVGQQQKIEILKALFLDASILIFDEPTAVLTPQEIDGFLTLLKQFKDEGKTIVLITHKLEEIKAVCSTATVIRAGKVVGRVSVAKTSTATMAQMMVGTEINEAKNTHQNALGEVILDVQQVSTKKLKDISFNVRAGEIVALAGVEGNGQSEIVEVIAGLSKAQKGKIALRHPEMPNAFIKWYARQVLPIARLIKKADGKSLTKPIAFKVSDIRRKSIKQRINLGIAHIPEDRHKHGLVLDLKIKHAIAIKQMDESAWLGLINERQVGKMARQIIEKYDVRGANHGESLARQLSGGNQQKAILGRELESKHELIIVAQPTRGLDVGAILNVHEQIIAEKAKSRAVLLVSYDLTEVMSLADRIIVLNSGKIVGEVDAKKATRQAIGLMMAGISPENNSLEQNA